MLDLGSWLILRMASGDTLRLVRSLKDAGIEAWAPVERHFARLPRKKVRVDRESAMMPSYVFADAREADQLYRISLDPGSRHPRFSFLSHMGGAALVTDEGLADLRAEESRRATAYERMKRRGVKGPVLPRGHEIKFTNGSFEGLSGLVVEQQGQYTLVDVPGFPKPLKIASWILLGDALQVAAPSAARSA